jgi:hypothetical protein
MTLAQPRQHAPRDIHADHRDAHQDPKLATSPIDSEIRAAALLSHDSNLAQRRHASPAPSLVMGR